MSNSVLFFSGGVESTAILEAYKDTNIRLLFVSSPWYKDFREGALKIAEYYKKDLEFFEMKATVSNNRHVQQLNWYLMVAYLYSLKWPDIKTFYYGLHVQDTSLVTNSGLENLKKVKTHFKTLLPNVSLISPFQHLTKKEQYDTLPKVVQDMIHTCNRTDKFCGKCSKCVEFLRLIKHDLTAKVQPPER